MQYEFTILEYLTKQIIHIQSGIPGFKALPDNWQSDMQKEGRRIREETSDSLTIN